MRQEKEVRITRFSQQIGKNSPLTNWGKKSRQIISPLFFSGHCFKVNLDILGLNIGEIFVCYKDVSLEILRSV